MTLREFTKEATTLQGFGLGVLIATGVNLLSKVGLARKLAKKVMLSSVRAGFEGRRIQQLPLNILGTLGSPTAAIVIREAHHAGQLARKGFRGGLPIAGGVGGGTIGYLGSKKKKGRKRNALIGAGLGAALGTGASLAKVNKIVLGPSDKSFTGLSSNLNAAFFKK